MLNENITFGGQLYLLHLNTTNLTGQQKMRTLSLARLRAGHTLSEARCGLEPAHTAGLTVRACCQLVLLLNALSRTPSSTVPTYIVTHMSMSLWESLLALRQNRIIYCTAALGILKSRLGDPTAANTDIVLS